MGAPLTPLLPVSIIKREKAPLIKILQVIIDLQETNVSLLKKIIYYNGSYTNNISKINVDMCKPLHIKKTIIMVAIIT